MATRGKKPPADTPAQEEETKPGVALATTGGNAVVDWEEEMAREAAAAAKMEQNTGGGQFFSIKGGLLKFDEAEVPNNQMAVIILDSILENVYYTEDYDPDEPTGPACFAFGRDEKDMVPHEVVFANGTQQSEKCATCQWNEWGTADKGKGKACKNARRLAMIGAGSLDANGKFTLDDRPETFQTGIVGFLRVPVTSVKGYATFVKQVASVLHRPPYGVIAKVQVKPHPKHQVEVVFSVLQEVDKSLLPIVRQRVEEVRGTIDFPYQVNAEPDDAPSPKQAARTPKAVKAAAGKKGVPAPAGRRPPAKAAAGGRAAKY